LRAGRLAGGKSGQNQGNGQGVLAQEHAPGDQKVIFFFVFSCFGFRFLFHLTDIYFSPLFPIYQIPIEPAYENRIG
jgi:hypothetical protein